MFRWAERAVGRAGKSHHEQYCRNRISAYSCWRRGAIVHDTARIPCHPRCCVLKCVSILHVQYQMPY